MIEVSHLSKKYGTHPAIEDLSFTVGDGQIFGLLGPNGAGKSTIMNILTGYLAPTSGEVKVAGFSLPEQAQQAKACVGYLPEQPPLYPEMTVQEYLDFAAELKGIKKKADRKEQVRKAARRTGLEEVLPRLIRSLSKGYRQRVGIAQALIGNPPVIIFDEPTVGLDPKQIIEIRNLIRTLGKDHTVILSTHILQEVQAVCDRILIINKGKLVADERTENINRAVEASRRFRLKVAAPQKEVLTFLRSRSDISYVEALSERDGDAYTFLVESTPGIDIRKSLFYALAERHWPMVGLEAVGMSLEDVFIAIVNKSDEEDEPRKKGGFRPGRRGTRTSTDIEKDLAETILESTAEKQSEIAPYEGED